MEDRGWRGKDGSRQELVDANLRRLVGEAFESVGRCGRVREGYRIRPGCAALVRVLRIKKCGDGGLRMAENYERTQSYTIIPPLERIFELRFLIFDWFCVRVGWLGKSLRKLAVKVIWP